MKAMWLAVACFGVLLWPSAARADMGFPGFKFREVRVVIDNLGDYPNHDFYLVAAGWLVAAERESGPSGSDKPPRVTPGEVHKPGYPARWAHNWMLVAVPRAPAGEATWKMLSASAPGVLYSNRVRLAQPDSVLILDPRDYEVRHFRVTLTDGELTLTPGAVEQGSDGFGSWLPGLLLAAAVTGLGFWVVRRVRRSRRSSTVITKGA